MGEIVYLVRDYICNEDKIYADEVDAIHKALKIYRDWVGNFSVYVPQSRVTDDIDSFVKSGYIDGVCCIKAIRIIDIGEED